LSGGCGGFFDSVMGKREGRRRFVDSYRPSS
jgi:hypothetical protein